MRSIDWDDGAVRLIDQTRLPERDEWIRATTLAQLVEAISRLAVRGAPSLGAAGALGVALAAHSGEDLDAAATSLRHARPTAVNLARGVDRVMARLARLERGAAVAEVAAVALAEARAVVAEEAASSHAIGDRGAALLRRLLPDRPLRLLTHCNTGWLACVEWGTALGIVATLHQQGRVEMVYADETRPLRQGARLTGYELASMGVPFAVAVDSAAASLLARGLVDAVVVGADRIAANGDVANKIGTYPLALAADRAGVPFVVAAPETTVDTATATGAQIPIEERDPGEVDDVYPAVNPAFDVTPYDLITAIVTDQRTIDPRTIDPRQEGRL